MVTAQRDITDLNDPYWPRVRRIYIYLWAKGTLDMKWFDVVWFSIFYFFLICVSGLIFRVILRGGIFVVMFILVDKIWPGVVACSLRGIVNDANSSQFLSKCDIYSASDLRIIAFASAFGAIIVFVYPLRKFLDKGFEFVFIASNIFMFGFPMKAIACLAAQEPTLIGMRLDKSYTFQAIIPGMILPHNYDKEIKDLWDVYQNSQSQGEEGILDRYLRDLEKRYLSDHTNDMTSSFTQPKRKILNSSRKPDGAKPKDGPHPVVMIGWIIGILILVGFLQKLFQGLFGA